jgi:hypothetical protein
MSIKLPPAQAACLTSRGFFPTLISPAFAQGLSAAFGFAAVACLTAALASLLRGGRYVYGETAGLAGPPGEATAAGAARPAFRRWPSRDSPGSCDGRSSCRCRDSQQSSPERRGSRSRWSFAEHPPGSPMRGKQASGARRDPQPQRYQISVRGRLGQTMCAAFPVLQARTDGDQTVLTGMLADQAALYGVLAEIEALGLELLEVRRLPPR